jgi:hypothetical protein
MAAAVRSNPNERQSIEAKDFTSAAGAMCDVWVGPGNGTTFVSAL